jgi:hypothetical protein
MTKPSQDGGDQVERGAAEEGSGVPLTETEKEVSQPKGERESAADKQKWPR